MDWSHIKKGGREISKAALFWNPQGNRKRGNRETPGEDR